ncbi:MAG: NAD-dependent deacetylase, partial [Candidatus Thorarchaeota archaeon]
MLNLYLPEIADLIIQSKHLVFFTGAGISTDSGLSDYRGPDGVWTRRDKGLPPKPSPNVKDVKPNKGHYSLVELQNLGLLKFLISQNVDNLHLKSGIKSDFLAELHGNHNLLKCIRCDLRYSKESVEWDDLKYGYGYRTHKPVSNQPRCPSCFGRLISSVVNFDDPMPEKEMKLAQEHTRMSDVFVVVGSSLVVQPAASFPLEAKNNGSIVIIINKGETPLDNISDYRVST